VRTIIFEIGSSTLFFFQLFLLIAEQNFIYV
jgi:hypothetical protein